MTRFIVATLEAMAPLSKFCGVNHGPKILRPQRIHISQFSRPL